MSNVWEANSNWFSMESLDLLVNKLGISAFFNKENSKEFKRTWPVGDTISVPKPARYRMRRGLAYNPEAINRQHSTIQVLPTFGVDFEWDSVEKALYMPRGRAQVSKDIIEPAMAQIAQDIDDQCAKWAFINSPNVTGALGTNPSTVDTTSAAARQIMVELGCPPGGDRGIIVPPRVSRAVKTSMQNQFNSQVDISRQNRTGIIGTTDNFEWYESMSLYRHTAGNWQTPASVTVNGASQEGTSLNINCTSGDVFKAGDKFSINATQAVNAMTRRTFAPAGENRTFTILADVTATSTTATLSIYPPIYGPNTPATRQYQTVNALPLDTALLTLWPGTTSPSGKSGNVGVALHEDAFAMVGIELEVPTGKEIAVQKRDPESGLAVRFIREFDTRESKYINRFDVMLGFGTFYADACSVAIACG